MRLGAKYISNNRGFESLSRLGQMGCIRWRVAVSL